MGNFSRALQHLDMKDVNRKRLKEIAAQKLKEQADAYEKKVIKEISKKYKSDWKREIYEGMTTANALTQTLPASDLENVINDTPTTNADVFADGPARENTEDDFSYDAMDHVGRVEFHPQPFAVKSSSKWKTFADFVSDCMSSPGKL